jgi:threonine aldolase
MEIVDLRSDTVTRPTAAMRAAMASAEVGDDVYGDDPTTARLERRVAELFVPSGTMANQIAIRLQTRPGDEVVIGEGAHCQWFESGAAAALSGVQFAIAGRGGLFDAAEFERAVKPSAFYSPRTALCALENTHNRAGGRIFPEQAMRQVAARARELGLRLHLDGARIWNAAVASERSPAELCEPFDTVSVCFSKGLGAPVGSAICLPADLVEEARRLRRMLGGAMRQSGILAAAALHGLDHHLERLHEDHVSARIIAEKLGAARGARVDLAGVETNIVNVLLETARADDVIGAARERGVLAGSIAPASLRLVTHLDVSPAQARRAAEILAAVIEERS